jgi:hypothetical protein
MSTPPISCISKEPFTKLEETGSASILNYNLPQKTTYPASSIVRLDINEDYFKAEFKDEPSNHFWNNINEITVEQAKEKIEDDLILASETPFIENPKMLISSDSIKSAVVDEAQKTYVANVDIDKIAAKVAQDKRRPVIVKNLLGKTFTRFITKPVTAKPRISLLFQYKMSSYLGDYGAGRTIKTFSLLPGERTTISIRDFTHKSETKSRAESVLDSFSEHTVNELQSYIEEKNQRNFQIASSFSASMEMDMSANLGIPLGDFTLGVGSSSGYSMNGSVSSALQTQTETLKGATSYQVQQADSLREVEVNTETSSTEISETEQTIVRELENINKSRVLNFVFRQLLQEFITITYLEDVSIMFTNGYPEKTRIVKLNQLDELLNEVLVEGDGIDEVRNFIYLQLCSIFDYTGTRVPFIEKVDESLVNCITGVGDKDVSYVRKKKGLNQTYNDQFTVPGIIMDVTSRTIRTNAVVVDALLGQGEALDCYNMKLQDSATQVADLDVQRLQQMIDTINGISDPAQKAELYKKVFTECCDVPQSCGCYNCNSSTDTTT